MGSLSHSFTKKEVERLTEVLVVSQLSQKNLSEELGTLIHVYRWHRAISKYQPKKVKNRLIKLIKNTEAFQASLNETTLSDFASRDPVGGAARMILLSDFNNALAGWQNFSQLSSIVHGIAKLARNALKSPLLNTAGGRRENREGVWFVSELAIFYKSVKGKKPGIGVKTPFYRFVSLCFDIAGHTISDPMPYIRGALRNKK